MAGDQVGTVGALDLRPNLVNVVPNEAVLTVDLRNTDEALLRAAEVQLSAKVKRPCPSARTESVNLFFSRYRFSSPSAAIRKPR